MCIYIYIHVEPLLWWYRGSSNKILLAEAPSPEFFLRHATPKSIRITADCRNPLKRHLYDAILPIGNHGFRMEAWVLHVELLYFRRP